MSDDAMSMLSLSADTPTMARDLRDLVRVGPGFVHIDERCWEHERVRAVSAALRLGDVQRGHELVPLFNTAEEQPVPVPGATLVPMSPPRLRPAALWIARRVYLVDEPVDIAVMAPSPEAASSDSRAIIVAMDGGRTRKISVGLSRGIGCLRLPPLPAGSWSVRLESSQVEQRFLVSDSREQLALAAAWWHRHVRRLGDGGSIRRYELTFGVRLLAYGHPLAGTVVISVLSPRGKWHRELGEFEPDAWGGVKGRVQLEGAGPFVLCLTSRGLGGRQARLTVPVPEPNAHSPLPEISFVPEADRMLVLEPLSGGASIARTGALPDSGPLAVVVAADVGRGERVHVIRRVSSGVGLAWAGSPGTQVAVTTDAPSWVLLAAWVGVDGGPASQLEGALRGQLGELLGGLGERGHLPDLFEVCGGPGAQHALLMELAGKVTTQAPSDSDKDAGVQLQGLPGVQPIVGVHPRLLRLEVLAVEGQARVTLPPSPVSGVLSVQAVRVRQDGGWDTAQLEHTMGSGLEAIWELPAYVADGDPVTGRLVVGSSVPAALVRICRNERPVQRVLEADGPDASPGAAPIGVQLPRRARISVPIRPGRWLAEVERIGTQERHVAQVVVSQPGRRRCMLRQFRCLEPGEEIRRSLGDGPLTVMSGPQHEIDRISRSILKVPWRSCESLAAGCVAIAVRFAAGLGSRRRLGELDELVTGLEHLFEPGRGFAVRERHGPMDEQVCVRAARHLVRLGLFIEKVMAGAVQGDGAVYAAAVKLLTRAAQLGVRAVRTLGLVMPPPADSLRHVGDAELLASHRPERMDVALATVRTRLKRRASRRDVESMDPRSAARLDEGRTRSDRAYGARLLSGTQDPEDVRLALASLAKALSDSPRSFLTQGGGYGTDDAVALLLALWDVRSVSDGVIRVVDEAGEEIEGQAEDHVGACFEVVGVRTGLCWVTWLAAGMDDLSDPVSPIAFEVDLRLEGQRTAGTQFSLGDFVEVHVSLGDPARGAGYEHGDWIEVHLPPALIARSRPLGDVDKVVLVDDGGRRIRVEMAGAHHCVIHVRAVMVTGARARPTLQRFAVGLRNVYDPQRGSAKLGLDIAVFAQEGRKPGGLLGIFG